LLATPQEFKDQVILGREVPVKGHLRGPGPRNDRVDADGAYAVPAEKLVGRAADPLTAAVAVIR
jgi:hypothetical protein